MTVDNSYFPTLWLQFGWSPVLFQHDNALMVKEKSITKILRMVWKNWLVYTERWSQPHPSPLGWTGVPGLIAQHLKSGGCFTVAADSCSQTFGHMVYHPLFTSYLIYKSSVHWFVFVCWSTVARWDAGVLSQCQSGAGRLQVGHEDRSQRLEGAFQTQTHSYYPRTGEECKENSTHLKCVCFLFYFQAASVMINIIYIQVNFCSCNH